MNFLNNFPKEKIIETIKTSYSPNEVLYKLGASKNSGSNKTTLKNFIKTNNIDISHFKGIPEEEIFINPSFVSQTRLRREFLKKSKNDYICSICGQEPTWNGKPLTLRVDHIDGNCSNNQMENLRWVCPNCDRQLSTFGQKKDVKKEYFCSVCGKKLKSKRESGMCFDCYTLYGKRKQRNVVLKDKKQKTPLKNSCPLCGKPKRVESSICQDCFRNTRKTNESYMINLKNSLMTTYCAKKGLSRELIKNKIRLSKSFMAVSKELDMDSQALKNVCKYFNLPTNKKDVDAYSDDEWKNI